jgi:hypothetical protein
VKTKLDEFGNKITILDEKVDSVQSFTNDLHNNSSTSIVAISGGQIKTKCCTFESMLQAWQSYCKENNTRFVPKSEFKLNGWVRDTTKAHKQYINNKPSTINKE